MPKQNPYLIENKKPIELVQELKDYEIKKSPLSPAARAKVVKKWGGNYVSKDRDFYGPGNSQSTEQTAKYVGKQAASKVAGSLLGPAALPVGAGLRMGSEQLNIASEMLPALFGIANGVDEEMANNPEKFFEELMKKVENKEKGEFAKWMDELGKDLMKSGAGDIIGGVASQSSGWLGKSIGFMDKAYTLGSKMEEEEAKAEFVKHLLHCRQGIDYDSDCKVCKS